MTFTSSSDLEYFATPGPLTEVRRETTTLDELPSGPEAIGKIVRGLLLHNWSAAQKGIAWSEQRDGMAVFGADAVLRRILALDAAPLDRSRLEPERLIGFCYHFALLHCAVLRFHGVPARTRCGFANYLADGKWIDHWLVEHWDGERWRANDPQIGLDDVAASDFRDGVRAWSLCRSGEANPADYGNGELWGWDELRGSLVNDIGALNKVEIGDWEWCELLKVDPLDQPHDQLDRALDEIASRGTPDCPFDEVRRAYDEHPAIQPPPELLTRRG